MMKRYILLIAFFLLLSSSASAQETTLAYDDGTGEGHFNTLGPGSIECIMFFIEHPASLLRVRAQFSSPGPVLLHAWRDGGGNDPNRDQPVIEPIPYELTEEEVGQWIEFDLSDKGIELLPLRYLHLGLVRQEGGGGFLVDTSTDGFSFLYPDDDPDTKYGVSDGNMMVQVDIAYHDIAVDLSFAEVTEMIGASSSHRPSWADYDNDGDDDLLISASKLLRNNGDGSFSDVSEQAGIVGLGGSGVWADYDNDGHIDYYAFNHGTTAEDRDRLVHNNGNGSFSPVDEDKWTPWDLYRTEAAAWADYDNDGWVDLYVANYEEAGDDLGIGTPDILWRNMGEGKFMDVSESAGTSQRWLLCGRGVNWGDFNNDGWIDLYVSNYRLDPNLLFMNKGDGTFEDVSGEKGVKGIWNVGNAYGHGIGSSWGDFDNDGNLDLVVGNLAHPRFILFSDKTMLYRNQGPPDYNFIDIREEAGITFSETHSDTLFWDYDNDGWLDLFITGIYTEYLSFLYHNDHDGTFSDKSYETGLWVKNGWGAAAADFDRDGDLDLATRSFFRNDMENDNHWLQVKLTGVRSNRSCIGCRVTISTGGISQIREVEGGKGTGVQNSQTLHFGLGDAERVDELSVRWSSGGTTMLTDLEADRLWEIEEDVETPVCLNNMGECLSETRLRICRNWEWIEEDCPEGYTCVDRFCMAPEPIADGDEEAETDGDDPDGDIPDGDIDPEDESTIDGDIADGDDELEESAGDGDTITDGDLPMPDGDTSSVDGDTEKIEEFEILPPDEKEIDESGCRNSGSASNGLAFFFLVFLIFRRIKKLRPESA